MVRRGIVVPEYEEVIEEDDNILLEEVPEEKKEQDLFLDKISPKKSPE
jgi:hypothetical protein